MNRSTCGVRSGGNRSASDDVSTEVTIIQKNGKIKMIVAGTSTRCHGLNGSGQRRRLRTTPGTGEGTGAVALARSTVRPPLGASRGDDPPSPPLMTGSR